ncbi:dihydroneopterin aldolase [Helicocarpus griseus UAMH5409]|uniref:dihydroneopterin aldolase n=1 Tax=Helicocarpus griseus UAMH5409 TaxID=1447875 RepID=A0A2B7WXI5_9EURO|nr:dihydroneopterin aldolase [Helicocarpus griseus UAMH5409]
MSTNKTPRAYDTIQLRNASFPFPISFDPDAWGRHGKPQPATFSVRISYPRSLMQQSGDKDDVSLTLSYGDLYRTVEADLQSLTTGNNGSLKGVTLDDVATAIGDAGHRLARGAIGQAEVTGEPDVVGLEVDVSIYLPKAILKADQGLTYRVVTQAGELEPRITCRVDGLRCNCIIGVNPHERENKQAVVVSLEGRSRGHDTLRGQCLQLSQKSIRQIANDIEESSFKTVESLAQQIAQTAVQLSGFEEVTASVEKPSAMPFVEYSGIEITRTKADF